MENEKLALQVQQGNRVALSQLWEAVRPLLASMTWKFYERHGRERCAVHGITLEDLKQESFIALVDAVRAYKPEKGYQFTTYLNYATENRFRGCMGTKGKKDALNYSDSLERPVGNEEESQSLGDTIPDEKAAVALSSVDDKQEQEAFSAVLGVALDDLSGIQGPILKHRFFYRHTVKDTAQALQVTPQDVRREESKGLRALRGNPRVCSLGDDMLETAAYRGTGWHTWYYERGSIEERLVESKAAWRPIV